MSKRRRQRTPRRLVPGAVRIRHIKTTAGLGDGPPVTVLDTIFLPSWAGLNGRNSHGRGWSGATFRPEPINDVGTATLKLPNAAGTDGRLHRERFAILTRGRARPTASGGTVYRGGSYRPGDEWLEVYPEGRTETPGFIGTPIGATITPTTIELQLADGAWLTKKARETAAGFWNHAPRDVLEHYSSLWRAVKATPLDDLSTFTLGRDNGDRVTADGWAYRNLGNGTAPGAPPFGPPAASGIAYLAEAAAVPGGRLSTEPHTAHRVECRFGNVRAGLISAGDTVRCILREQTALGTVAAMVTVQRDGTVNIYTVPVGADVRGAMTVADVVKLNEVHLAIETRGRWAFFYVAGNLVGVLPFNGHAAGVVGQAYVSADATAGDRGAVQLLEFAHRRTRPYAAGRSGTRGDARLPGAPTPGGLIGEYFNDADLNAKSSTNAIYRDRRFEPGRTPYARRLEPTASNVATGPPAGPPASEHWSCRMMGALYLDLAAHDYRLTWAGTTKARIWVGDTRVGTEVARWGHAEANVPLSVGMRSLFGQVSGWYPILVEHSFDTVAIDGATPGFGLLMQTDGGASAAVPATILSPVGIVQDVIRFDSHFDVLDRVARDFGYQWRPEPRQLESGAFPVEILPRVRVGRDTDRVLDDATGVQSAITAEDVADTLLADAAGLSDPNNQAAMTAEAINYAELVAGHLHISSEYEQASGITVPELLVQRLSSLLELRGGTWEEVSANPAGARELADTFPLTGALAEFAWRPGDGIRLDQEPVGVVDALPRAIVATEWPATPAGLGTPQATFRSRRRDVSTLLRGLVGDVRDANRTYQGQLVQISGAIGGSVAFDAFTRLALPASARIVRVWVTVMSKSDGSVTGLELNGTVRFNYTRAGEYDVTAYAIAAAAGSEFQFNARASGGTGTNAYQLNALVLL